MKQLKSTISKAGEPKGAKMKTLLAATWSAMLAIWFATPSLGQVNATGTFSGLVTDRVARRSEMHR